MVVNLRRIRRKHALAIRTALLIAVTLLSFALYLAAQAGHESLTAALLALFVITAALTVLLT